MRWKIFLMPLWWLFSLVLVGCLLQQCAPRGRVICWVWRVPGTVRACCWILKLRLFMDSLSTTVVMEFMTRKSLGLSFAPFWRWGLIIPPVHNAFPPSGIQSPPWSSIWWVMGLISIKPSVVGISFVSLAKNNLSHWRISYFFTWLFEFFVLEFFLWWSK